ncbi:hypothetical protein [Chromobacterium sp. CV08]|uniref:hypothetical protein n=1 Tax=Chromobacterium sp. CV08 TaxID=3133274 RepID=UPI003DAA3F08
MPTWTGNNKSIRECKAASCLTIMMPDNESCARINHYAWQNRVPCMMAVVAMSPARGDILSSIRGGADLHKAVNLIKTMKKRHVTA